MFTRFKINADKEGKTWVKLKNCTIYDVNGTGFKVDIDAESDLQGILYLGNSKFHMSLEFVGTFSVNKYTFVVTGLENLTKYYFYIKNTSGGEAARTGIYSIKTGVTIPIDIDIGSPAEDRLLGHADYYTLIAKDNPANGTGKITKVSIWAKNEMKGVIVATFTEGAPNVFTARDSQAVADIPAGLKVDRTVSIDVVTGDYIGVFFDDGGIAWTSLTGEGRWFKAGDQTSCVGVTFTFSDPSILSLYGTGVGVS